MEGDLPWDVKDLLGVSLLTLGPASSLSLSVGNGISYRAPKLLPHPYPVLQKVGPGC